MPVLTISGSPTFNGDSTCTIDSTGTDRVQPASSVLSAGIGWMVLCVRPVASAAAMSSDARVWSWEDADTAMLTLYWSGTTHQFGMARQNGGTFGQTLSSASTHLAGDRIIVACRWDTTTMYVSRNSETFATGGQASVPLINDPNFDFGRRSISATQYLNAAYVWVAAGRDALTQSDVTNFNALGDTDPTWDILPASPSFLWTADNSHYFTTFPGSPFPAYARVRFNG